MRRGDIIRMAIGLVVVLGLGFGMFLRSPVVENPAYGGATMGTGYSVKIVGKVKLSKLHKLSDRIEAELAEVNRQMSTWDEGSEISRFSRSRALEPFECSEAFATVVRRALELSESTGGAFDPTLQPLLNLWGFGSGGEGCRIPTDDEIEAVRQITGWEKLKVDAASNLVKTEPETSLALGAIAKGYGVDVLARLLDEAGFENWFAEIGGEVVVRGLNPEGVPWRIGIEYPSTNPMDDRLQGVVHMTNGAVATSGNYHNFIEEDGRIYSHILDPRTGRAIRSDVAGVTVTAPNCMDADGMATSLYVMGADEGLVWVERRNGVEAMFLLRDADGEISERFSSGFREATGYTSSL